MATSLQTALKGSIQRGAAPTESSYGFQSGKGSAFDLASQAFADQGTYTLGGGAAGGSGAGAGGGAGGAGGAGAHGGTGNFTGVPGVTIPHNASGNSAIYDALVKAATGSSVSGQLGTSWLTDYKDALINQIIPAARAQYGDSAISGALASAWKKAIYAAYSAVSSLPGGIADIGYYDRGDDPNSGNLFKIAGFVPNVPGSAQYGSGGLWT